MTAAPGASPSRSILPPRAGRPAAFALAPLLWRQGVTVRRTTPALPEAAGPRTGTVGGARGGPELRLLVVGESTAAGVGADDQRDGLAHQLARQLAEDGTGVVRWRVLARSGVTAHRLRTEVLDPAPREPHDVAVVVLGVNDTLRLRRPAIWRRDVARVVEVLRHTATPGASTILCGVPDVAGFPALPPPLRTVLGAHARHLDDGLADLARAASAQGRAVTHVPVPPVDADAFATDGFHPGAVGYRRWAEQLATTIPPPQT